MSACRHFGLQSAKGDFSARHKEKVKICFNVETFHHQDLCFRLQVTLLDVIGSRFRIALQIQLAAGSAGALWCQAEAQGGCQIKSTFVTDSVFNQICSHIQDGGDEFWSISQME